MKTEVQAALERLKLSGLKITAPRKAIVTVLSEKHGPFTADEIHQLITRKICDQATVYRTLLSLEKKALLNRCEFGDGVARYELSHPEHEHHHHVICRSCKRVEVIEDEEIEDIDRFAKKLGFTAVSHILEFFGLCPNCR